jgi:hypothetical protein
MDLGTIWERLKTAPARAGEFFKRAAEKFSVFLNQKAGPLADGVLSRIPAEKRRLFFFCLGGSVALLMCIVVITLITGAGRPKEKNETAESPIPPEDLFFPGEPDFVPSLLLEREPRRFWTPDDIAPFWDDPGNLGRAQWKKEMEAVIDTLMEDVP